MLLRQAVAAAQESRSVSSDFEQDKLIHEVVARPSKRTKNVTASTVDDVKSDPPWNVMIKRLN